MDTNELHAALMDDYRDDWRQDVANGDTRLGFDEWMTAQHITGADSPPERRKATPQHRNSVHVAALLLLRLYEDDYLKALERAADWTAGADPDTFTFYADVTTLLSRRYATLTGGRDG